MAKRDGGKCEQARALQRMKEALVLLDSAGLVIAGCHLQMAIDVAAGTSPDREARGSGSLRCRN